MLLSPQRPAPRLWRPPLALQCGMLRLVRAPRCCALPVRRCLLSCASDSPLSRLQQQRCRRGASARLLAACAAALRRRRDGGRSRPGRGRPGRDCRCGPGAATSSCAAQALDSLLRAALPRWRVGCALRHVRSARAPCPEASWRKGPRAAPGGLRARCRPACLSRRRRGACSTVGKPPARCAALQRAPPWPCLPGGARACAPRSVTRGPGARLPHHAGRDTRGPIPAAPTDPRLRRPERPARSRAGRPLGRVCADGYCVHEDTARGRQHQRLGRVRRRFTRPAPFHSGQFCSREDSAVPEQWHHQPVR
mmetsp:Transcript_12872/g.41134  ORF Transcript_12872/g.41134 Transcript_12872/m.41134 type:complete len:308 (+) Transcript_12872:1978-2901(+)